MSIHVPSKRVRSVAAKTVLLKCVLTCLKHYKTNKNTDCIIAHQSGTYFHQLQFQCFQYFHLFNIHFLINIYFISINIYCVVLCIVCVCVVLFIAFVLFYVLFLCCSM